MFGVRFQCETQALYLRSTLLFARMRVSGFRPFPSPVVLVGWLWMITPPFLTGRKETPPISLILLSPGSLRSHRWAPALWRAVCMRGRGGFCEVIGWEPVGEALLLEHGLFPRAEGLPFLQQPTAGLTMSWGVTQSLCFLFLPSVTSMLVGCCEICGWKRWLKKWRSFVFL